MIDAYDLTGACTRWTLDREHQPGCMFSMRVEGSANVFALVRALNRGEDENSALDDGTAADMVASTS